MQDAALEMGDALGSKDGGVALCVLPGACWPGGLCLWPICGVCVALLCPRRWAEMLLGDCPPVLLAKPWKAASPAESGRGDELDVGSLAALGQAARMELSSSVRWLSVIVPAGLRPAGNAGTRCSSARTGSLMGGT